MAWKRTARRSCTSQRTYRRTLQLGNRTAGAQAHLERSLDALAVPGCDARGRDRIEGRQLRMQSGPAKGPRTLVELCAQDGRRLGQARKSREQGAQIEHRAAHQQGHAPARVDRLDRDPGVGDEASGGVALGRLTDVHQVVGNQRPQRGGGLGGADVQAPVHQRGIHTDDLDRGGARQRDGPVGLAAAGGS
jgi:hypothetical protein